MEGLLLRLSALDADAENAVRVIGFFDRLIANHASLDTVVQATRQLAECPAGIHSAARGITVGGPAPAKAAQRELEDGTVVWLHRDGTSLPLDEMLLERFAIAVAVLLDHARLPLPSLGDPALVELALSGSAGEADRSRALHLLELKPTTKIRVLAVDGTPAGLTAPLGELHAVLVPGEEIPKQQGRTGVSPKVAAIEAPEAWSQARTALRFATTETPVRYEDLGAQVMLAALPAAEIADHPDVRALDRLAEDPQLLTILAAVSATSSIRQAASSIHRHHSSLAARLTHAEETLGFPLDTPDGRFRLRLALVLRQLRDSA